MKTKFTHYDLDLITPKFDSSITDLIIELDYLRKKEQFLNAILNKK